MKKVYPERTCPESNRRGRRGFTLIELIVTITIVGVLSAIGLTTYPSARKKARDTQRQSDLSQYRSALETYASSNDGIYPINISSIANLCGAGKPLSSLYISNCPDDPSGGTTHYGFFSSSTGDAYILYALLEMGGYWEICSDGKLGKLTSAPAGGWDSVCDL